MHIHRFHSLLYPQIGVLVDQNKNEEIKFCGRVFWFNILLPKMLSAKTVCVKTVECRLILNSILGAILPVTGRRRAEFYKCHRGVCGQKFSTFCSSKQCAAWCSKIATVTRSLKNTVSLYFYLFLFFFLCFFACISSYILISFKF